MAIQFLNGIAYNVDPAGAAGNQQIDRFDEGITDGADRWLHIQNTVKDTSFSGPLQFVEERDTYVLEGGDDIFVRLNDPSTTSGTSIVTSQGLTQSIFVAGFEGNDQFYVNGDGTYAGYQGDDTFFLGKLPGDILETIDDFGLNGILDGSFGEDTTLVPGTEDIRVQGVSLGIRNDRDTIDVTGLTAQGFTVDFVQPLSSFTNTMRIFTSSGQQIGEYFTKSIEQFVGIGPDGKSLPPTGGTGGNGNPTFVNISAGETITIPENTFFIRDINSTDPDGDAPIYSIVGGADAARFAIDPSTGELIFLIPPDFENDQSLVGNDDIYDVTVRVEDGKGGFSEAPLFINVTPAGTPPAGGDGIVDGENFNEFMGPGYNDNNAPTNNGGDQIDGTDGDNDVIRGNDGADTIEAGAGNDTVNGDSGQQPVVTPGNPTTLSIAGADGGRISSPDGSVGADVDLGPIAGGSTWRVIPAAFNTALDSRPKGGRSLRSRGIVGRDA